MDIRDRHVCGSHCQFPHLYPQGPALRTHVCPQQALDILVVTAREMLGLCLDISEYGGSSLGCGGGEEESVREECERRGRGGEEEKRRVREGKEGSRVGEEEESVRERRRGRREEVRRAGGESHRAVSRQDSHLPLPLWETSLDTSSE